MKNIRLLLVLTALLFVFTSCDNSKYKELIIGHWNGVEWLEEGQPSAYTPAEAEFGFDTDGAYQFTYAGNTERGTYYITNNELYTTPTGGIKMMVKIVTLNQDSLVFDMNRGGIAEKLTLVRK